MTVGSLHHSSQLFRVVNEHIVQLAAPLVDKDDLWLVCECPNVDCMRTLQMTHSEFQALLDEEGIYAVVPGHEAGRPPTVVDRTKQYVLVSSPVEDAPLEPVA
jgi:hypothetical protein